MNGTTQLYVAVVHNNSVKYVNTINSHNLPTAQGFHGFSVYRDFSIAWKGSDGKQSIHT